MKLAWLDLETTGLDPAVHEILEIAIIVTDEHLEPLRAWSSKVAPTAIERASVEALTVAGYSADDWAGAPSLQSVMPTVRGMMANAIPAGHNVRFDLEFLREAYRRTDTTPPAAPHYCLDTVSLAWPLRSTGEIASLSLDALCQHFSIERPFPHRAAADIRATLRVAWTLAGRMNGLDAPR